MVYLGIGFMVGNEIGMHGICVQSQTVDTNASPLESRGLGRGLVVPITRLCCFT